MGRSIKREQKLAAENHALLNALRMLCNAKRPLDWSPSTELAEAFAYARSILLKLGQP